MVDATLGLLVVALAVSPSAILEPCLGNDGMCPGVEDIELEHLEECAWCIVSEGMALGGQSLPALKASAEV